MKQSTNKYILHKKRSTLSQYFWVFVFVIPHSCQVLIMHSWSFLRLLMYSLRKILINFLVIQDSFSEWPRPVGNQDGKTNWFRSWNPAETSLYRRDSELARVWAEVLSYMPLIEPK